MANNQTVTQFVCDICCHVKDYITIYHLHACDHGFCRECLITFLQVLIDNSQLQIPCPNFNCKCLINQDDIFLILKEQPTIRQRWERLSLQRALAQEKALLCCPANGCAFVAIAEKQKFISKLKELVSQPNLNEVVCGIPDCKTAFCSRCGVESEKHVGIKCPSKILTTRKNSFGRNVRRCPGCRMPASKDGGCNFVRCPLCGCQFCWYCGQETENVCFLHWAAYCSMKADRVTRRLKKFDARSYWKRWLTALGFLLLAIILLPLLVTWSIFINLPYQLWADWYYITPGSRLKKVTLLLLLYALFYPVFVVVSPILWILLYFDCWYDVFSSLAELLCRKYSFSYNGTATAV